MTAFPPAPRFVAAIAFAFFSLASAATRLSAQETPPAGPVVEMPKVVVTDSRDLPQPESWRYGEIPGFEILTNASNRASQQLISDFQMFKQALGVVWPLPNRGGAPVSLILCGKGAKFDAFMPPGKSNTEMGLASLFLKAQEQTVIVIDLERTILDISNSDTTNDAATGTDSTRISVEHNKQLYREYVHYLLSRSEPRLPAWLEEGMAQIIMAMQFDRTQIVIGRLRPTNEISAQAGLVVDLNAAAAASADAEGEDAEGNALPGAPAEDLDFNVALQRKRLVALDKFFAVTHDSPEARNPLGNNRWAKQAYAFVHMCLYGHGKRYQKGFAQFVMRSAKEPVTEAMFKECFGMNYKQMGLAIRGYCDFTAYEAQELNMKKGSSLDAPPPVVFREATQSEVGRIKGEALVIAGHKDKARAELIGPYIRGERDPRLLAALGLYEQSVGEEERARKYLEAAMAGKVVRPRAYLELARYRFNEAVAASAATNNEFSAEQVKGILAPLLAARTQTPQLSEIYGLMADTWTRSAAKPTKEDVVLIVQGYRVFQGRLKTVYQTAALCLDLGVNDAATTLIDYGLRVSPDAKTKANFEKLKAALPPPAASKG